MEDKHFTFLAVDAAVVVLACAYITGGKKKKEASAET